MLPRQKCHLFLKTDPNQSIVDFIRDQIEYFIQKYDYTPKNIYINPKNMTEFAESMITFSLPSSPETILTIKLTEDIYIMHNSVCFELFSENVAEIVEN